jgi:hypothetical protein
MNERAFCNGESAQPHIPAAKILFGRRKACAALEIGVPCLFLLMAATAAR